ncbi:Tm-1-like ATP-binding domain-containing protein, partial [Nocardiopsis chromatogenes]|uniref:Tm-1-like ATP-binding domain-containing protein n=1 Tax=Nocardiopsis chromatogenes TaxID=280239 RepID=UPI00178CFACC
MSAPAVAVLGTLDTKGAEVAFAVRRLAAAGLRTVVVDTGTYAPDGGPRADVAVRE